MAAEGEGLRHEGRGIFLLNVPIVINQTHRRNLARKEASMLDVAEWTNNKSQGSLMPVCPYVFCHIAFRGDHYIT
jgi:hypothetical protein